MTEPVTNVAAGKMALYSTMLRAAAVGLDGMAVLFVNGAKSPDRELREMIAESRKNLQAALDVHDAMIEGLDELASDES